MYGNKTVSASFASGDPNLATVTVTIKPDAAANAGMTWSVTGDSQLRASGTSLSEAVGSGYTAYLPVTLNLVAGWLGTNGITSFYVPITAGIVTNVTLTCVPDTTPGLLTVTLSPPDAVTAGAHWHVNGVTYGNGGSASLTPGNYTVTFDTVSGWTAPVSQLVTMLPAQSKVIPGNYTPPAGQPAIYSVSPPIGTLAGGTLLTINGVNFTVPTTVLIGGQAASNISVSSATQITCSTPSSSTNGTVPIVVQTAGGSTTNQNGFAYGISLGKKLSLLSATGGSIFGTAVQGNYAYIGEGRNFLVLDVSSPSSPSRVGKVTLPGVVVGVALFGQYAYVADGEGGVQVVDITTPSLPVIRGYYSPTNYTWSAGIKMFGGRAYVADEINGFEILDLGNPTTPTLLSCTNFGGWADDDVIIRASGQGAFAYITTEDKLQVVDVSQPTTPVLLGQVTFTGGGGVATIAMSGNYVFGGSIYDGGKMHIVDVSNPNSPIDSTPSLGGYGTGGYCSMAAANNYLYVQSSYSGFGFTVFSISGSTLTQVGRYSPYSFNGYYNRMVISGTRVYMGGGQTGFVIFDISSPFSPSLLSTFTDAGLAAGYQCIAVTGNALCAPDGVNFKVFNVSQPGQPALAANISGTGTGAGGQVLAHNGVAFLKGNGTQVYDVTTPSSPHLLATISNNVANNYRMALADNRLYIVGNNGLKPTFVAVDISTPSLPSVLGTKTITTSPDNTIGYSVAVSGNRDISNISAPIEQGSLTNYFAYDIRISVGGNYAYFVDANSPSILRVLDINNPSNPVITNNLTIDASQAMSIEILGNELYVATLRGVYVFDTSNPQTPILSRSYAMSYIRNNSIGVTSDSAIQSGIIYMADGDGGVAVLNEQDIQPPNVYITTPVFAPVYTNNSSSIGLGGGSDDNVGVTAITWANDRGGSGQVSLPLDNWYVSGIKLYPGSNNITATAFDAAGNSGIDILTVIYPTTNQNQTITFPAIANHTFGDPAVTLNAAASSGLPITFSVVSGPATLTSSNVLTLNGAGTVTVQASQPGNSSYNPAPSTNVSFNVSKANQSISFAPIPAKSASDAPVALTATTSSGLPVYFNILSGPATLDTNNNLTFLGGGSVTVLAWQPGNSNYNAAGTMQQSFNVSKIPQTITFGALSPQKQGDAPFPLNATADSGLLVSFSVSGPATLSGNIVTLTGHGTVNVTASQPGNNSYAAATPVIQSFSVTPPDNTLVGLGFQNNGGFQMAFYGMAGSNYTVQASSNLLNWQPFTNFIITVSPYNFTDPTATNFNWRFYRATRP
jgi:hypothetical protein